MLRSQKVRKLAPEMDPLRLGMGWKLDDLEYGALMKMAGRLRGITQRTCAMEWDRGMTGLIIPWPTGTPS